jgi:hypothetical protein
MASTASSRTFESWTFAALRTTASGTPRWSATIWRFEPAFPLSVGFGLVLCPPFLPTHSPSQEKPYPSLSGRPRPGGPGAPDVVLPTLLPPASRASVASTSNPIHSPSLLGEHLPGDVPLFKTKTMPARAARSSIRGLPPCGLGGSLGNSGSIVSHNSSDTSSLLISTSVTSAHKQVLQDALRCRPTTPCG